MYPITDVEGGSSVGAAETASSTATVKNVSLSTRTPSGPIAPGTEAPLADIRRLNDPGAGRRSETPTAGITRSAKRKLHEETDDPEGLVGKRTKVATTATSSASQGQRHPSGGFRVLQAAPRQDSIPKRLHIVWLQHELPRPERCIESWSDKHRDGWEVCHWGEEERAGNKWVNAALMNAFAERGMWGAVATLMRWEILEKEGGIAPDADSRCLQTLPNWLLDKEVFACAENELACPGQLSNKFVGARPGHPLLSSIVTEISRDESVLERSIPAAVGAGRLTWIYRAMKCHNLAVLPSHLFMPHHPAGRNYTGGGLVLADHLWGATTASYKTLPFERADDAPRPVQRIPKNLYLVWIGPKAPPAACIQSWLDEHFDWSCEVIGNDKLYGEDWTNKKEMLALAAQGRWEGVADLIRYERVGYRGGVALDADSRCVRRLDDWLLELEAFVCWENELNRPGLLAMNVLAAGPGNAFFLGIVEDIRVNGLDPSKMPWQTTGPGRLTENYHRQGYENLTILPSHTFVPQHFSGVPAYSGGGPVYATQFWGTTFSSYEQLQKMEFKSGSAAQKASNPSEATTSKST